MPELGWQEIALLGVLVALLVAPVVLRSAFGSSKK